MTLQKLRRWKCGILVREHVGIDVAEGQSPACACCVVEGLDDVFLKRALRGCACTTGLAASCIRNKPVPSRPFDPGLTRVRRGCMCWGMPGVVARRSRSRPFQCLVDGLRGFAGSHGGIALSTSKRSWRSNCADGQSHVVEHRAGVEQFGIELEAVALSGERAEVIDAAGMMEQQRSFRIAHQFSDGAGELAVGTLIPAIDEVVVKSKSWAFSSVNHCRKSWSRHCPAATDVLTSKSAITRPKQTRQFAYVESQISEAKHPHDRDPWRCQASSFSTYRVRSMCSPRPTCRPAGSPYRLRVIATAPGDIRSSSGARLLPMASSATWTPRRLTRFLIAGSPNAAQMRLDDLIVNWLRRVASTADATARWQRRLFPRRGGLARRQARDHALGGREQLARALSFNQAGRRRHSCARRADCARRPASRRLDLALALVEEDLGCDIAKARGEPARDVLQAPRRPVAVQPRGRSGAFGTLRAAAGSALYRRRTAADDHGVDKLAARVGLSRAISHGCFDTRLG